MIRLSLLPVFVICLLVFQSCLDIAEITVTYTKGTPIYGDLNAIRQTPLLAGKQPITNPGKIFISEEYLLIGEEGEGVHIIDNKDQKNPQNVAFLNIPGNREYYFYDHILYAESYYDMLKIDLSDPMEPKLIDRIENAISDELKNNEGETLLGFEFEVVTESIDKDDDVYERISGGELYIFYDYNSSIIPPSAVPASFAGNSSNGIGSVNRIIHHRGYLYAVSRSNLLVFDDNNGFKKIATSNVGWNLETVFPMDDYLFLGAQSEVAIVNVSDPYNPVRVSSFWHATSCDPVYPTTDEVAYVTLRTGDASNCPGDENVLLVLDIQDLQRPFSLQEISMESPYGLTKYGDKLYVSEGENGFKIFDASNPKQLTLEKWVTDIPAYDVLHHPSRPDLLLIAGPNGLNQYETQGTYSLLSTVPF